MLAVGVVALLILPWTVRNFAVYSRFLPLNSNAGYALYSANHPQHGVQFDPDYAAPLPPDLIGQGLDEAGWNAALTQRGLQLILSDPRRYLLLSLDRATVFFNFWFSPESDLPANLMRVLSFGLYLPFFVYGLLISLRDWRRYSLIYLFTLVYSAIHVLTWASIRYRLPVDAALMPIGALALVDVIDRLGGCSARLYLAHGPGKGEGELRSQSCPTEMPNTDGQGRSGASLAILPYIDFQQGWARCNLAPRSRPTQYKQGGHTAS